GCALFCRLLPRLLLGALRRVLGALLLGQLLLSFPAGALRGLPGPSLRRQLRLYRFGGALGEAELLARLLGDALRRLQRAALARRLLADFAHLVGGLLCACFGELRARLLCPALGRLLGAALLRQLRLRLIGGTVRRLLRMALLHQLLARLLDRPLGFARSRQLRPLQPCGCIGRLSGQPKQLEFATRPLRRTQGPSDDGGGNGDRDQQCRYDGHPPQTSSQSARAPARPVGTARAGGLALPWIVCAEIPDVAFRIATGIAAAAAVLLLDVE